MRCGEHSQWVPVAELSFILITEFVKQRLSSNSRWYWSATKRSHTRYGRKYLRSHKTESQFKNQKSIFRTITLCCTMNVMQATTTSTIYNGSKHFYWMTQLPDLSSNNSCFISALQIPPLSLVIDMCSFPEESTFNFHNWHIVADEKLTWPGHNKH
jgi:hypothetical protein